MLVKNWAAIRQIPDRTLKLAIINCQDQAILAKLQLGFPECFREGEKQEGQLVPLSEIRGIVGEGLSRSAPGEECLQAHNFPVMHLADASCYQVVKESYNPHVQLMPPDVVEFVAAAKFNERDFLEKDPLRLNFADADYLVLDSLIESYTDYPDTYELWLLPCALIDETV